MIIQAKRFIFLLSQSALIEELMKNLNARKFSCLYIHMYAMNVSAEQIPSKGGQLMLRTLI